MPLFPLQEERIDRSSGKCRLTSAEKELLSAQFRCRDRAQVMDLVQADIRAKPAHDERQFQVRGAAQGSLIEIPIFRFCPLRILEPVLHREQPDSGDGGHRHGWKLHYRNIPYAEMGDQQCEHASEREIQ
jgi:hypothetical protein